LKIRDDILKVLSSSLISRGPDKSVGYLKDQSKARKGEVKDHPHPNPLPSRERSFSKVANYGRMYTPDLLPLDGGEKKRG